MHISDLEYVETLERSLSITGGELPPEIFKAKLISLKQEVGASKGKLSARIQLSDNTNGARNRATGGDFSRIEVIVFEPDITAVGIDATAPTSNP
ncbi:MAG: hypothetical protein VKK04_07190 [Synechococcales bacterium]|nr:hypothetical protein [Synechococcales bacterium]